MRRIILLILPILLVGCRAAGDPPPRHLVVSGSESLTPLVADIAARFQAKHPEIRVDLNPAPAKQVVENTRQGLVDVAFVGRGLRAEESDLQGITFANDGLAFIVNPSNPIAALDEKQLVGLFLRTYTDWREVGGSARRVVLVGLTEGRAVRDFMLARFGLTSSSVRLEPALYRNDQVIEAVARTPGALGFVALSSACQAEATQAIRLLPQKGIAASMANVRNGRYPYIRPLAVASRKFCDELTRELVDFACSPEVHDLIDKHGFVPAQQ